MIPQPPEGTAQEGGGADSGDTHQTWPQIPFKDLRFLKY